MKSFLAIAFLSTLSISEAISQARIVEWLSGTWKLSGKDIYEVWTVNPNGELDGYSFKVTATDTVVTENISLKFVDGSYHYIADVAGDQEPVDFVLTTIEENGFMAENPLHDFPKLICYRYEVTSNGPILDAKIEGDGKVIQYRFYKIE